MDTWQPISSQKTSSVCLSLSQKFRRVGPSSVRVRRAVNLIVALRSALPAIGSLQCRGLNDTRHLIDACENLPKHTRLSARKIIS